MAVTSWWLVGVPEVSVGARGVICIVGDVQVVTTTKRWSFVGMIVYGIVLVLVHSGREYTTTITSKQEGSVTTAMTPPR